MTEPASRCTEEGAVAAFTPSVDQVHDPAVAAGPVDLSTGTSESKRRGGSADCPGRSTERHCPEPRPFLLCGTTRLSREGEICRCRRPPTSSPPPSCPAGAPGPVREMLRDGDGCGSSAAGATVGSDCVAGRAEATDNRYSLPCECAITAAGRPGRHEPVADRSGDDGS